MQVFRLPPDCIEGEDGNVYRIIPHYKYATQLNEDGSIYRDPMTKEVVRYPWPEVDENEDPIVDFEERRPVATTLEEAQDKRIDFYHRELGWIREGYKLEKDRSAEAIMSDASISVPNPKIRGK